MSIIQPVFETLDDEIDQLANTLSRQIQKWAPEEGLTTTAVPGLELIRSNSSLNNCVGSTVYDPSLCLIAQGSKTVWLGDREIQALRRWVWNSPPELGQDMTSTWTGGTTWTARRF